MEPTFRRTNNQIANKNEKKSDLLLAYLSSLSGESCPPSGNTGCYLYGSILPLKIATPMERIDDGAVILGLASIVGEDVGYFQIEIGQS